MIKRLQYSVLPEAALGLLFAVLAFFAVFASYDIERRADKSKLVKSSELAFSTSRYLLDFMELEMAARRAGLQDASLRDGMLKLRYDIALGRMDLLNSGELKQETDKAIRRRIDAATQKFAGIVEAMNDGGCDTACRSARIAEIVPSIRRELAFLQTEGFKRDSNLRGMMQKSIGASVTWMTQLSWAVLASAAVFVIFTLVRYRMLLCRTYALRKSRDELRVISKYRANFMAGMSHEFRTPLNAIKGFSEFGAVIVQDAKPEKLKEYFGYIHDAAANLEQLTNTLLDLSKIDAGIFKLNREDVDLGDLLSGVVREIDAATGTPGRIAIDNACEGTLDCDPSTVHRCVSNLISNAIKYSPADSPIRISTRVEGGMVAIAVRDHGRGIPADELEEVWSLYSRSSYFRGDEIEGTGLGLTITRALVETHGGEVRIESEVGSGTTVTLCFPADERLVPTAARPYSPEVEAA